MILKIYLEEWKNLYERLATEVNANLLRINTTDTKVLNTSGFVSKTKYDSEKQNLEKKI